MRKIILAGMLVLLINGNVWSETSGFYAGAGFGRSEVSDACVSGLTSCDDEDTGTKIFGGLELSRYFNLELSYVDLGEINAPANISGVPVPASIESDGFSLVGIGVLPFRGDMFFLTAKAGLFRWDVTAKASAPGASASISDDGVDLMFGFGGMVRINEMLGLRAEWERYRSVGNEISTREDDVELISVSGMLFFK